MLQSSYERNHITLAELLPLTRMKWGLKECVIGYFLMSSGHEHHPKGLLSSSKQGNPRGRKNGKSQWMLMKHLQAAQGGSRWVVFISLEHFFIYLVQGIPRVLSGFTGRVWERQEIENVTWKTLNTYPITIKITLIHLVVKLIVYITHRLQMK